MSPFETGKKVMEAVMAIPVMDLFWTKAARSKGADGASVRWRSGKGGDEFRNIYISGIYLAQYLDLDAI
jgi:hypothetical protein